MSSRAWIAVIALGLVLGVPALAQEPRLPPPAENAEPGAEPDATNHGAEPSDEQPRPQKELTEPKGGSNESVEPADTEPEASQGSAESEDELTDIARRDLAAQQSMAESTWQMAVAAWVAVGATLLGILLIWRTLVHTRIAAIAASDMVEQAKATTVAANASVDEARKATNVAHEAYLAEQRAWISVELDIDGPLRWYTDRDGSRHASIDASARITNIGKTPALNVHTQMDVVFGWVEAKQAVQKLARESRHRNIDTSRMLIPRETYNRPWGLGFAEEKARSHAAGEHIWPVIIGCVTYEIQRDKKLHQTAFAFALFDGNAGETVKITIDIPPDRLRASITTGGFAD